MATTIKVNLNSVGTILADRKLEKGGQAQRFMTGEIYRLSKPYMPFDNNPLTTEVTLEADSITHNVPYAKYQYYGKVMKGTPRRVTNKSLRYHGEPMRGRCWVNRAMADRKQDVVKAVEDFIKKGV